MDRTDREVSRLVLSEGVALLRGAQRGETQIDAREALDQRAIVLPRMPRTQPLEQFTTDFPQHD
ncbi:MAG: hypothetical protein ACR2LK_05735 [Solirubrobacteraceae bacterium]